MKAKKFLESKRGRCATMALSAIIIFTLFFHMNAIAHMSHHQKDMHSSHQSSPVCSTNFCCIQISQNNFAFESNIISSNIFNLPLSTHLYKNLELPYKPPKF